MEKPNKPSTPLVAHKDASQNIFRNKMQFLKQSVFFFALAAAATAESIPATAPMPPCAMCLDVFEVFEGEAPNHSPEDVASLLDTVCDSLTFEHHGDTPVQVLHEQCVSFVVRRRLDLARRLVQGGTAHELCFEFGFCEDSKVQRKSEFFHSDL
jgi:hypothetical protein